MNNYTDILKIKKSFGAYVGAALLLFIANVLKTNYLIYSILVVLSSIFLLVFRIAMEFDFNNRKYRYIIYLYNFRIGRWKTLPEIEYISIFEGILSNRISNTTYDQHLTYDEYAIIVCLCYGHNMQLQVFKTLDINKAFEKAIFFSDKLNVKIFDGRKGIRKWYTPTQHQL